MPSPPKIPKTSDAEIPKVTENSQNFPAARADRKFPIWVVMGLGIVTRTVTIPVTCIIYIPTCWTHFGNSHTYSNPYTFSSCAGRPRIPNILQLRGLTENSQHFPAARTNREFPKISRCAGWPRIFPKSQIRIPKISFVDTKFPKSQIRIPKISGG